MSAAEYAGGPGMGYASWVEEQTPAGQARARMAARDEAVLDEFLAYEKRCRDRAALAEWAATGEAQETAARARTIGLADQVSATSGPTHPDAGPQCPPTAPSTTTVGDPVSPAPTSVRRPAGASAVGPRPGAWARLRRWWSE